MIKTIYPYITLDGEGQEAIEFYEDALDAKVVKVQTFGEMPPNPDYPIPEDAKERILNAHLIIGDTNFMISDTFPGPKHKLFDRGFQVTIAIIVNSVEKSKEVFQKLTVGGEVMMPIQETFWSPSYGQVKDQFGVQWQVSTELDDEV